MKVDEVLDGKYKLVRQIGVGGMGSVWEALQLPAGRRVAVKSLHHYFVEEAELTARFLREARAALEARYSGHIIEVIDVVNTRGQPPYMVMEYLEGEDLSQILQREGPLEIKRAVDLVIQSCEAIDEVHRQGIIHRDIKPDNLFVIKLKDGSEWIKLLDFGVAKFNPNSPKKGYSLTKFGHTLGTPDYMAPEQAMGTVPIDYRVDIYSLGVVTYQLLAGQMPYRSDDLQELMIMSARGNPPLLSGLRPDVPAGLETVVSKTMAVEREDRFQSMFDLAGALQPYSTKGSSRHGRGLGGLVNVSTIKEKLPQDVMDRILSDADVVPDARDIDPFAATLRHRVEIDSDESFQAPATLIESSPMGMSSDVGSDDSDEEAPTTPRSKQEPGVVVAAPVKIIDDAGAEPPGAADDGQAGSAAHPPDRAGGRRPRLVVLIASAAVALVLALGVLAVLYCRGSSGHVENGSEAASVGAWDRDRLNPTHAPAIIRAS